MSGSWQVVAVTLVHSVWLNNTTGFTIDVNGRVMRLDRGRTLFPLPPGRHRIATYMRYPFSNRRFGLAETVVDLRPGETVDLEYRYPLWEFAPGSLGPPPQQYNGRGRFYGGIVGVLAGAALLTTAFLCLAWVVAR